MQKQQKIKLKNTYFEELVNLAQVDSLLGIQFVDITYIPVHQVQPEAHDLPDIRSVCSTNKKYQFEN